MTARTIQCEWCEQPATYRIECASANYARYSCAPHGKKIERLADLDLGKGPMRKHTASSVPFEFKEEEEVDHGDNCRFD